MKGKASKHIFAVAAAATAALLLPGCQEKSCKHSPAQEKCEIQTLVSIDTSEMDEKTRHRIILIKSANANGPAEK